MGITPDYAGTASRILNTAASTARIITSAVFGSVVDQTGNWTVPFAGSIGLEFVGAIAAVGRHSDQDLESDSPGTAAALPELV